MSSEPRATPRRRRKQISAKALAAFALVLLPLALGFLFPSLDRDYPPEVGLILRLAILLSSVALAVSVVRDARRSPDLNTEVPAATMVLAILITVGTLPPAAPFAWLEYYRVPLGGTEGEVMDILGPPADGWRHARHLGRITSPGAVAMPYAERGVPLDRVRQEQPHERCDGHEVVIALPAAAVEQAGSPTVRMRQWWGRAHAIDVAFNEHGRVVGVYLAWLRPVNCW